jgi:hypothetical protein
MTKKHTEIWCGKESAVLTDTSDSLFLSSTQKQQNLGNQAGQ